MDSSSSLGLRQKVVRGRERLIETVYLLWPARPGRLRLELRVWQLIGGLSPEAESFPPVWL